MKNPWHKGKVALPNQASGEPVPIVADGAIATKVLGEGRLIPLLILDTSKRPDIEDMIKVHKILPPGDVKIQWGRIRKLENTVSLFLQFQRPSEVLIILDFNVTKQGILVEQILKAKSLYLQPGRTGDRLSTTMDNPKIIVEVPDLGFQKEWKKIWLKELTKIFRTKGLRRVEAKLAAGRTIHEIQAISNSFSFNFRR
jgi:hypothetical protein